MSIAGNLTDKLEESIVNGEFRPGEKLEENRLTQLFKVSRTPVREALRQLASTDLITIIPNRGAFVADPGVPHIIEMFEVMAELEAMCGRLAARRITGPQRAVLLEKHRLAQHQEEQTDSDGYYYQNEQFHYAIYDASNNDFLAEQAKKLHRRLKPYRRLQLRVPHRLKTSCVEHGRIVEAILSGDEQQAEIELKNHILIQGERFSDFVSLPLTSS